MIINSLKASGFGIMGEPIRMEFPAEGKIGVLGQNECGKTTLLQTIECALYGLRKGAGIEADRENLVTWGKNEARLEIQFTSGQDTYVLQRVIGAKSGHKASLTQVIGGIPDKTSALTSLKDIESKVEQITGMDRNSFTKLIYIKQKDLDALKELVKSKREQLVNKVMGIELFDDAINKVKDDKSELENELEKKELRLQKVQQNKDEYESRLEQKSQLETEITKKQQELKNGEKRLDEAKELLGKFEWLFTFNSTKETQSSLRDQEDQVEKDLLKLDRLEKDSKKLGTTLEKYKPEVLELQCLHDKLLDLEKKLAQAKDSAKTLQTQKSELETETAERRKNLKNKEKLLNDAKASLTKYEWLLSFNSAKETESSLKDQRDHVETEVQRLLKLEESFKKLSTTLDMHKTEVLELQSLRDRLSALEKQVSEAEDSAKALCAQKQSVIEKLGLSGKDLRLLSQNTSQQKHRQIVRFGVGLMAGMVSLVGAFLLTSPIIGGIGLALMAIAAYFFSQYLKIDRLLLRSIDIETLSKQIQQEETRIGEFQVKKEEVSSQSSYKSSKHAQDRLEAIFESMKKETGESSIDGIEALLRSTNKDLKTLRLSDPQSRQRTVEDQIQSKQAEIERIEKAKPASADGTQYNKKQHESSKKQLESIQGEYDDLKQRISNSQGTIETLSKQIQDRQNEMESLSAKKTEVASQSSFKNHKDAKNRLAGIFKFMKQETGENSIDGIEALLRKTKDELETLKVADLPAKKTALENQIQSKQTEIERLEKTKPAGMDEMEYTEALHASAKKQLESIQEECIDLKQNIGNDKGTLKQIEKELKRLQPDFDACPALQREVEDTCEQIDILKRVNLELSETSKELRNRVIPHARFVINQILPTLTDGRYSDFEITEDLKFKVHSNEAGAYKEREIFSGGTQDQFLIALRLAFTQSILDSRVLADKYSLLMDECISSSDDVRKQGIFEVLEAMKKTFSQIFIIAHEDVSAFVDNHIVLDRNEHGYTEIRSKSW